MLAALLTAALAAAPAPPVAEDLSVAPRKWAQDDEWVGTPGREEEERHPRIRLGVWGGEAFGSAGTGRGSGSLGGEVAWAFDAVDVGVSGAKYRNLKDAERTWTPVVLARVTQRFKTRRGIEAAFGFGLGAGERKGWGAWYQVALGLRVPIGPMFLAGELAFEQYDLLRVGAGFGVAF